MPSVFHVINQDSINKDNEGAHVIVKNIPFVLVVSPNPAWSLLKCKIKCRLLYDFEDESDKKEVTYIKQNPLEYRVLSDTQGTRANIEFKISTLSSQHEDSLFKIELVCLNIQTKEEEITYSEPIRVLSKRKTAENGGGRRKRGFRDSIPKESSSKKSKQIPLDDISSSPPLTPTPSPDHSNQITKQFLYEKLIKLEQEHSKTIECINSFKVTNEFSTMFENLATMYFMLSPEQQSASLRRALQSDKGKVMASAICRETGSETILSPYFVDVDFQDIMGLSNSDSCISK